MIAQTILGIDSKHPSGIRSSLYQASGSSPPPPSFSPSLSLTLFKHGVEFKSRDEVKAILEKKQSESKPAVAAKPKQRTLEEEKEAGLGDFDEVSESEDEEPRQKKQKTK